MGIIMWGWPLSLSSVLDPVHFFVKCLVVFLFRVPPWCMMMANLVSIPPEGYLGDMITQGASYVALREHTAGPVIFNISAGLCLLHVIVWMKKDKQNRVWKMNTFTDFGREEGCGRACSGGEEGCRNQPRQFGRRFLALLRHGLHGRNQVQIDPDVLWWSWDPCFGGACSVWFLPLGRLTVYPRQILPWIRCLVASHHAQ